MRRLAWLVAAMPLLVLAYLAIAPDRAPVAQPRVEQPYRRIEGRLIFASDKVPSLALPDGSYRRVRSVLDIPKRCISAIMSGTTPTCPPARSGYASIWVDNCCPCSAPGMRSARR